MTPTEILQQFVGKYETREYCKTPFVVASHVCATNGHVLVKVPTQPGMVFAERQDIPINIPELFEKNRISNPINIPKLPKLKTCSVCDGKGSVFEQPCVECDGDGTFEHGSHSYDCKECEGTGSVRGGSKEVCCYNCSGLGGSAKSVEVGGSYFDARYLAKLIGLPGIVFNVAPNDPSRAAYFVFDSGEGLLMPRRPD